MSECLSDISTFELICYLNTEVQGIQTTYIIVGEVLQKCLETSYKTYAVFKNGG